MPTDDPIVPSGDDPPRLDDPPPIFNTWSGFYAFVLILHAIIVALFYFMTRAYA